MALVRKRLSITRLASRIGKSKSTVSLVLRGKLRAHATARRIADILDLAATDFERGIAARVVRKSHGEPHSRVMEKGSREALLYALNSPSRCAPDDVDSLQKCIDSGAVTMRFANPLIAGKKRK